MRRPAPPQSNPRTTAPWSRVVGALCGAFVVEIESLGHRGTIARLAWLSRGRRWPAQRRAAPPCRHHRRRACSTHPHPPPPRSFDARYLVDGVVKTSPPATSPSVSSGRARSVQRRRSASELMTRGVLCQWVPPVSDSSIEGQLILIQFLIPFVIFISSV